MGKYSIALFLLSVVFASCKKAESNTTNPVWEAMVVFEENSSTPIPGVRVDCFTCVDSNPNIACSGKRLFSTGYTDSVGKYVYSEEEQRMSSQGITLTKDHYFNAEGGPGKRFMTPSATFRMHIVKQQNYPANTAFEYYQVPTRNSGAGWYRYISPLPTDSLVTLQLPANETYTINWNIVNQTNCSGGICSGPYLNSGSVTGLRLKKQGDTLININY